MKAFPPVVTLIALTVACAAPPLSGQPPAARVARSSHELQHQPAAAATAEHKQERGIHVDLCPNAVEDIDGFDDEDGCPDLEDDERAVAEWISREERFYEQAVEVGMEKRGCFPGPMAGAKQNLDNAKFFAATGQTARAAESIQETYRFLFVVYDHEAPEACAASGR